MEKRRQINHEHAHACSIRIGRTFLSAVEAQTDNRARSAQKFCQRGGTARLSHPQLHAHTHCRNIPNSLTGHSPPSLNERHGQLTSPEKTAA